MQVINEETPDCVLERRCVSQPWHLEPGPSVHFEVDASFWFFRVSGTWDVWWHGSECPAMSLLVSAEVRAERKREKKQAGTPLQVFMNKSDILTAHPRWRHLTFWPNSVQEQLYRWTLPESDILSADFLKELQLRLTLKTVSRMCSLCPETVFLRTSCGLDDMNSLNCR